ncbi:hypothetical protein LXL04_033598 [Taraxacum kok-saghyz]
MPSRLVAEMARVAVELATRVRVRRQKRKLLESWTTSFLNRQINQSVVQHTISKTNLKFTPILTESHQVRTSTGSTIKPGSASSHRKIEPHKDTATRHRTNKWDMDSSPSPQSGHNSDSITTPLACNATREGSLPQHNRQIKIFTFLGTVLHHLVLRLAVGRTCRSIQSRVIATENLPSTSKDQPHPSGLSTHRKSRNNLVSSMSWPRATPPVIGRSQYHRHPSSNHLSETRHNGSPSRLNNRGNRYRNACLPNHTSFQKRVFIPLPTFFSSTSSLITSFSLSLASATKILAHGLVPGALLLSSKKPPFSP